MTTSKVGAGSRILGSLRSAADGTGIVRMENRFDTDIDDDEEEEEEASPAVE